MEATMNERFHQEGTSSISKLMYIQTLAHTSSHYTTQQSFDPSCTIDGLGEIQAAHPWLPHWSDAVTIPKGITKAQVEGLTKTHQL